MVTLRHALSLASAALGALGGLLLFVEFFQLPSYVTYQPSYGSYNLAISPQEAREYSWAGRIGALLLALAFALLFVDALL